MVIFSSLSDVRAKCYLIDDINVDFVTEVTAFFQPLFTSTVSSEVRVERIKLVSRVISKQMSMIPPESYRLGLNRYSLDTPEERRQLTGYVHADGAEDMFPRLEDETLTGPRSYQEQLPERVDWVEEGALTIIKDQERCGCCWALSLMTAVESATFFDAGHTGLFTKPIIPTTHFL